MARICVFCGASPRNNDESKAFARTIGQSLAESGIGLVFGGGAFGMMGALAEGFAAASENIIGITPRFLLDRETRHPLVEDLRVVDSMHERKLLMYELSDGFLALPGGFGTLEEIFEILTWRQLKLHSKPVAFLADGIWNEHLGAHFLALEAGGFISGSDRLLAPILEGKQGLSHFIKTVEEATAQAKPSMSALASKT